MKKLVIGAIAMSLIGCTTSKLNGPSGSNGQPSWSIQNQSFLWTRANVKGSIDTNGVFSFSEDTSTPDQKTIESLASILAGLVNKAP